MGTIYEALERAEKELEASHAEVRSQPQQAAPEKAATRRGTDQAALEYEGLRSTLRALYPKELIKVILFTGGGRGVGTSRTALGFARCLASDQHTRVLLVNVGASGHEASGRKSGLLRMLGLSRPWDVSNGGNGRGPSRTKLGPEHLEVLRYTGEASEPGMALRWDGFKAALQTMRDSYDYVVVDAPSVYHFPECRVLCAVMDGVVLVVESGRTHRQAALRAKKILEQAGGKLLGVVLNKKRYYLPQFLYRRL
ncbi:MAG: hypothetical protein A2Y74_01290 [Actinobacteria bacterium RBG_13_63_9]|jgi:Mrp family chromosome partitioning ATPase|nr:MAG: hypothetical protein A2Y74_01290 [Actinobacteria bacterium RBG_13_63_9]